MSTKICIKYLYKDFHKFNRGLELNVVINTAEYDDFLECYIIITMIKIIAGGRKHLKWVEEAVFEYEKRLKKPFDVVWELVEEEKLNQYLAKWPFLGQQFVILLDERGKNLSSPELSEVLSRQFVNSKEVVIIIGGAFGVSEEVRQKSNLVWSLSRLVFPHQLVRVMLAEQIYRAQEIAVGGKYHHE